MPDCNKRNCEHEKDETNHCSELECPNYRLKCDKHAFLGAE